MLKNNQIIRNSLVWRGPVEVKAQNNTVYSHPRWLPPVHVGTVSTLLLELPTYWCALQETWASLVVQIVKFDPWVGKIPWRRGWLPTPLFLPREFHGQKNLAGYSPWGHKESDMTEWLRTGAQIQGCSWCKALQNVASALHNNQPKLAAEHSNPPISAHVNNWKE